MERLENAWIAIEAHPQGGELYRITGKKTGADYLWHGDPAHWRYRAPVLFPIVGKVCDGRYRAEGQTFSLPQHGLARLRFFDVCERTAASVAFRLTADSDTRAVYPYLFSLTTAYALQENNVITTYAVKNTDTRTMYFSLGGHPAFLCPMRPDCAFEDYYLEFDQKERLSRTLLTKDGYFTNDTAPFLADERRVPLSYDLFENDAIVVQNTKSRAISLKSDRHKEQLTFHYSDFPFLGLWSKPDAPFVCIEPWFGHADAAGFTGTLADKEGILSLAPGETFRASYTVEIIE